MSVKNYQDATHYEYFIRRAHKSLKTTRNGADALLMQSLMNLENGTVRRGSPERQLEKVKSYIGKALDKFLKLKLTEDEKAGLLQLKANLEPAFSSEQLMQIITKGLDLTQRFKDYKSN